MKRIYKAFFFSMDGLIFAWKSEAAFRQICLLAFFGVFYALYQIQSDMHALFLIFSSFLCVVIELLNSAVEKAVDHTSLERHPLAKAAKDMGSAAQLIGMLLFAITFFYTYSK
ncbi:MAG: diacylglycerol kinase [Desulfovibrionaceae bacterium]